MSYKVISQKFIIISIIALIIGIVCYDLNFLITISPIDTIFFILIVFPLGIVLGQAENRRFKIMELLSIMTSQIISLAFAYRDWPPKDKVKKQDLDNYKKGLINFLKSLVVYLGIDNNKDSQNHIKKIVDVESNIGSLSKLNERMRELGVPANEISRANQYINKILDNFEIIRAYKSYNTSKLVLQFLEYVLIMGCFILIPHFLNNGFVGILVAPIILLTFSSLINIEKILDNPLIKQSIIDTIDVNFGKKIQKRIETIFDTK